MKQFSTEAAAFAAEAAASASQRLKLPLKLPKFPQLKYAQRMPRTKASKSYHTHQCMMKAGRYAMKVKTTKTMKMTNRFEDTSSNGLKCVLSFHMKCTNVQVSNPSGGAVPLVLFPLKRLPFPLPLVGAADDEAAALKEIADDAA